MEIRVGSTSGALRPLCRAVCGMPRDGTAWGPRNLREQCAGTLGIRCVATCGLVGARLWGYGLGADRDTPTAGSAWAHCSGVRATYGGVGRGSAAAGRLHVLGRTCITWDSCTASRGFGRYRAQQG